MAEQGRARGAVREGEEQPRLIVRAMIGGRVQGVGYRAWTQIEAEALGLEGWVRNRMNGEVEALFAGPKEAVEAICARLWRGPPAARVARVDLREADPAELSARRGAGFQQIGTV